MKKILKINILEIIVLIAVIIFITYRFWSAENRDPPSLNTNIKKRLN